MESYYMWVVALLVVALTLKYTPSYFTPRVADEDEKETLIIQSTPDTDGNELQTASKSKEFAEFQKWYIVIFLLVMLADWMQGPYVYKLYSSYGLETKSIAILFVIGFGTSGVTGAFIGSLADKFGRKKMCCLFCVCYCVCCVTKHFHHFDILLLGRVLGGISTSILFSCFEAWMVTTHNQRGYAPDKLGDTFEKAWSLNAFIAVGAGIITSYAVQLYEHFGIVDSAVTPFEVAAFDCSAITLCVALFTLNLKWKRENYGDSRLDLKQSLSNAMQTFRDDFAVALVGVIQSGFESAMYLFVFMWTMSLEKVHTNGDIDHGMVFAVFMEACLVGTTLCGLLSNKQFVGWGLERIASLLCVVAAVSLCAIPYTENYEVRLFLFIAFECCVGVYFPTIGGLRSKYVPDDVRATIMNIFRIPLNVIVVIVLWYIDELGLKNVFMLSTVLLGIAAVAAVALKSKKKKPNTPQFSNEH